MEYDIGSKIKAARLKKKMTQEQVAELLGVSRQTISNWENEKSYPDIISVIKMSDYYEASLDYLLKGEQKMNTYYDYLEESTNVVRSNTNRNKIITMLSYLLIWAVAMIVFWFFTSGSDGDGLALFLCHGRDCSHGLHDDVHADIPYHGHDFHALYPAQHQNHMHLFRTSQLC